jgi:Flp pilus assembly pilin Flp
MLALLKKLLDDEGGFVVSSELILIATIVCLGMVVGLTEVTFAVSGELIDVANAYNRLNQGRRYNRLGWSDNHWNVATVELNGTPARDEDH